MRNFRTYYDWTAVSNPITDEEIKVWIAALRSNGYAQGSGQMKYVHQGTCCYCCLGVANQVWNVGTPDDYAVMQATGDNGIFFKMPYDLQRYLYGLNDSRKMTFAQIADEIERGFGLKEE